MAGLGHHDLQLGWLGIFLMDGLQSFPTRHLQSQMVSSKIRRLSERQESSNPEYHLRAWKDSLDIF